MPPLPLEGDTLGEKRRHFNKLVADAVASKHYELTPISDTASDIDNLLKIEIACKTRNVDYVIEVMKSKDMLYAATAIKKSTWLITDPQYANIINPEYLHTQLKPYMTTKAFNKLMLHVRLNLKDESRVEDFYEYLDDEEIKGACKWLQNCSTPFIENVIKCGFHLPMWLFKRLCKNSTSFQTLSISGELYLPKLYYLIFMFKSQTESVLNMIEDKDCNDFSKIGRRKTEILMKKYPQRVIENFEIYCKNIDLSVVAKYIKKEEMLSFLHKNANYLAFQLYDCESWGYFINRIPLKERFKFVKNTFINKTESGVSLTEEARREVGPPRIQTYQWYEFAPFNVAFSELKKLIRKEIQPAERCAIILVLISCGSKKSQDIKTLLKFLYEIHVNEPFKFKIQFIHKILFSTAVHEYDVDTWHILNQFFYSMEVYTETERRVEACRESIVLYKVLHDEAVPEIVLKKLPFQSLATTQRTLNRDQKCKIFTYLLNTLLAQTKIADEIVNESDFIETFQQIKSIFTLLKDWEQEITCYTFILKRIQELTELKDESKWNVNMSCLYNVNKSWRKYMFEESLSLSLCEETCLNALKHKPQLLTRHDKQIHTLRTNDAVSLRRVSAKLRVYWPDSLAQHWAEAYMQSLNDSTGQKAIIKGIFLISPVDQVIGLAKKHVPTDVKINWSNANQAEISIQKNIAKHLHMARPLVPLDTVLWYAKGDYLQYAVPSLNAILFNLSEVESREYLPKVLDAPVSLQKLGLRLAYTKFEASEIMHIISDIWTSTKNATIRAVIFEHTFNQLCSPKYQDIEYELWELLSIFMNDVKSEETTSLYKILSYVKKVPINIRGQYFMKSYEILKSLVLPVDHICDYYLETVIADAADVMELLDEDFVVNKLLSPLEATFCNNTRYSSAFACFVLCGESEKNQLQRLRKIENALKDAFRRWYDQPSYFHYVKNIFEEFLNSLVQHFRGYFIRNEISVPVKMFEEILRIMKKGLQLSENYVLITCWTLITEYVKCMNEHASVFNTLESSTPENTWQVIHSKVSPCFGKKVINFLKEDIEKYTWAIHDAFADALNKMCSMFSFTIFCDSYILESETLAHIMLYDRTFIPCYLVVCKCMPKYCKPESEQKRLEILNQIKSHPSPLVRIQYYRHYLNKPY